MSCAVSTAQLISAFFATQIVLILFVDPKFQAFSIFSSPVQKYRIGYCTHPGVGISVGVGIAQMFKLKFISLYLLNMLMD